MAAGVTDRVWEISDIVELVIAHEERERTRREELNYLRWSKHGDALGHGQTNL
jgi:hypothetical protein